MTRVMKPAHVLGISLLEVLLSLSIIAIILIMATRYFFVASHNDKINTAVSQIGGLIAAIHNYKSADAVYDVNTTIETLANAGQLANFPGYDQSKKTLTTMWGNNFELTASPSIITINVTFPDQATCLAVNRAYPQDLSNNITAKCDDKTFTYSFP